MNEFEPIVSIIIPTYNRADFLQEALRSVLAQTFVGYELIVVDDGSTDRTPELARQFPQVRWIREEVNAGVSRARNLGIQQSRGRYLCFLDSDDLWKDHKLQVQVDWMHSHPECQVAYSEEIWIRRGVRVNPMNKHRKYSGDIFRHCLPLCIVSPSSVILRAEVLAEVGLFDESLPACEDYDLWLRIAVRHPFHLIDEPLMTKRGGHEDQLSSRYWGMDRFRVSALEKLIRENNLDEEKRGWVLQTLEEKCTVLVKGFSKRGNEGEADYYRSLIRKYFTGGYSVGESL